MAIINNGLPLTNLKVLDIRDTLAANGGKVNNKFSSYFKESANINRWSKHKPIVTDYINDIFLDYNSEKWNSQAGTAPTVFVGLVPNDQALLEEIWNGCSEDEWFQYKLPTGGTKEPLRIGDFRGYRADATSPFKSFSSDSTQIEPINGTANFYLNMRYYLNNELDSVEGGMLSLQDMEVFEDNEDYTMVVITKYNDIYTAYDGGSISTASWGEMQGTITIGKINNTNEGIYECAVALRNSSGLYFKLPFEHIILSAEIYYPTDFQFPLTGEAYYNSSGNNSYVSAEVIYKAGETNESAVTITGTFYIGASPDDCNIHMGYGSITLEPREKGTIKCFSSEETFYSFNQQILPLLASNSTVYMKFEGGEATAVEVSGN